MPMHDWTRVKSGTYHNFHVLWMSNITNRLNAGLLPPGFLDRKSTRLNSSHIQKSRMPSSA